MKTLHTLCGSLYDQVSYPLCLQPTKLNTYQRFVWQKPFSPPAMGDGCRAWWCLESLCVPVFGLVRIVYWHFLDLPHRNSVEMEGKGNILLLSWNVWCMYVALKLHQIMCAFSSFLWHFCLKRIPILRFQPHNIMQVKYSLSENLGTNCLLEFRYFWFSDRSTYLH